LSVYPLDTVLHVGAHVQVRTDIGNNNRTYSPVPFVRDHAVTLRAAGASAHHALTTLRHVIAHVAAVPQFNACVALADALYRAHWSMAVVNLCIDDFLLNANGLTGADWGAIATALGANRRADTVAIARLPGWNAASLLLLAQAHTANNPNNFPVPLWVAIANIVGANYPNRTAAFARIGWKYSAITTLAQNYVAANPNNFTAADWAALTADVPAHDHAAATALARISGTGAAAWNFVSAQALAQARTAANPNNLTVVEWVAIAAELPANAHADTTAFATTRGRGAALWNGVSAVALAQAFQAGNPNHFTGAEWKAIAGLLAANAHADTATFARANGGGHAAIVTLATRFGANARGATAAQWIAVAIRMVARPNRDALTENAMTYLQAGWPDSVQINVNGVPTAWHLEASNDGVVYRQTGVANPHITVHALNGNGPNWWRSHGAGDLHVRTNALWDFTARQFDPFLAHGAVAPAVPPAVQAMIDSFCQALHVP